MEKQSPQDCGSDREPRVVRCINGHKTAVVDKDGRVIVRCHRCKHDVTVCQGADDEHGKEDEAA